MCFRSKKQKTSLLTSDRRSVAPSAASAYLGIVIGFLVACLFISVRRKPGLVAISQYQAKASSIFNLVGSSSSKADSLLSALNISAAEASLILPRGKSSTFSDKLPLSSSSLSSSSSSSSSSSKLDWKTKFIPDALHGGEFVEYSSPRGLTSARFFLRFSPAALVPSPTTPASKLVAAPVLFIFAEEDESAWQSSSSSAEWVELAVKQRFHLVFLEADLSVNAAPSLSDNDERVEEEDENEEQELARRWMLDPSADGDDLLYTLSVFKNVAKDSSISVDLDRIYAIGTRSGGDMVINAALHFSSVFAAAVASFATVDEETHMPIWKAKRRIPLLLFSHSSDDRYQRTLKTRDLFRDQGHAVSLREAGRGKQASTVQDAWEWLSLQTRDMGLCKNPECQ